MTDKLFKKNKFDCVCKFLEVELYSFLDNLEGKVLIIGLTIYLFLYFLIKNLFGYGKYNFNFLVTRFSV